MGTPSFLLPVAGAALALSLGLNVYLATRPSEPPVLPVTAPLASAGTTGESTCCPELERCHQENWKIALRAMSVPPTPADAGVVDSGAATAPRTAAARSGPVEQDEALTRMAREQVRLQWKAGRGAIVPFLLRELEDPAKQDAWTKLEVTAMADSAGLTASQRDRLERDYSRIRAANAMDVKNALSRQPPDAAAAVAATKALYASEDELMARVAGDEARDRWRAEAMHHRTALVAVYAALGDQPWDNSLSW